MDKKVKIRPMEVSDAKAVALIHTESWRSAYEGIVPQDFLAAIDVDKREERWAQGIVDDPSLIRLVAVNEDEKVLGFVCGLKNRDDNPDIQAELWAIYVAPDIERSGLGSSLFTSFQDELRKRDMKSMNVWVLEDNLKARNFYETMGGKLSSHQKQIEIGRKNLIEVSYEYDLRKPLSEAEIKGYIGQFVSVEMDQPIGSRYSGHGEEIIYPVNYGFIPNTISGDGEELDAYVLGVDEAKEKFNGRCIAVLHRTNDNDDKLIVVPDEVNFTNEEIDAMVEFQEKFFNHVIWR